MGDAQKPVLQSLGGRKATKGPCPRLNQYMFMLDTRGPNRFPKFGVNRNNLNIHVFA